MPCSCPPTRGQRAFSFATCSAARTFSRAARSRGCHRNTCSRHQPLIDIPLEHGVPPPWSRGIPGRLRRQPTGPLPVGQLAVFVDESSRISALVNPGVIDELVAPTARELTHQQLGAEGTPGTRGKSCKGQTAARRWGYCAARGAAPMDQTRFGEVPLTTKSPTMRALKTHGL